MATKPASKKPMVKDTPAMMKREIAFMKRNKAPKDMIKHEQAEAKAAKGYACGGKVKRMK